MGEHCADLPAKMVPPLAMFACDEQNPSESPKKTLAFPSIRNLTSSGSLEHEGYPFSIWKPIPKERLYRLSTVEAPRALIDSLAPLDGALRRAALILGAGSGW